jgi:hypothetical protein
MLLSLMLAVTFSLQFGPVSAILRGMSDAASTPTATAPASTAYDDDTLIEKDYFRHPEAARQLHMSERALWRLRERRIGPPAVLIGKYIYYPKDSLRVWLKSLEEPRPTPARSSRRKRS